MHLVNSLVLVTSLCSAISYAGIIQRRDGFSVQQTVSGSRALGGPRAYRDGLRRYKKTIPKALNLAVKNHKLMMAKQPKGRARKAQNKKNGNVTASPNQGDEEYTCIVNVGGQNVNLDFDTGSSDLWVYSSLLPKASIGNHSFYDPSKSSSSKIMDGATWNISYGDGSGANGKVYTDVVSVGGTSFPNQAIELASSVSAQFLTDYSNDGLLGLGFDIGNTINPNPQKTFFTNVRDGLALPLFTVDLKHQAPGSYDFGFIDPAKYSGPITYVTADSSQGYWGTKSTTYAVGDASKSVNKTVKTIVDTGTTQLLVPQDMVEAYYAQVSGSVNDASVGGYTYPCSTTLPDLFIGFDGYTAKVPGTTINSGPVDSTNKMCFGGMQTFPASDGLDAIFGDIFLKAVFVVFEAAATGDPRIGFADKASAANQPGTGSTTISVVPVAAPSTTDAADSAASDVPAADNSAAPIDTGNVGVNDPADPAAADPSDSTTTSAYWSAETGVPDTDDGGSGADGDGDMDDDSGSGDSSESDDDSLKGLGSSRFWRRMNAEDAWENDGDDWDVDEL